MDLQPCKSCDKKISPLASFCPRCGRPGDNSHPIPAAVRDIEMSFSSMITFMVKASIASIPALMILMVIAFFSWAVLAALFGARH